MSLAMQTEEEKPKRKNRHKISKLLKIKKTKKHGKEKQDPPFQNSVIAEHPGLSPIIKDVKLYANNAEIYCKSPAKDGDGEPGKEDDDEPANNSKNSTTEQQFSLDDKTNTLHSTKDHKKHRKIKKAFRNFAKFKAKTPNKAGENVEIPYSNDDSEACIKPINSERPSKKHSGNEDYDYSPPDITSGSLDADLDVKDVKKSKPKKSANLKLKNPLKVKLKKEKKQNNKNSNISSPENDTNLYKNKTVSFDDDLKEKDSETVRNIQDEKPKSKTEQKKNEPSIFKKLNLKSPFRIKTHKKDKKDKKQSDKETATIENQSDSRGNNNTDGKSDAAYGNDTEANDNEALHGIQEERSKEKTDNKKLTMLKKLNFKTSSKNKSFKEDKKKKYLPISEVTTVENSNVSVSDNNNQNKAGYDIQGTDIEGPLCLRDFILDYEHRVRKCENEKQSSKTSSVIERFKKDKKKHLSISEVTTVENSNVSVSDNDNQNKAGYDTQGTDIEGPLYLQDFILDYEHRVRKCETEKQSSKKSSKLKFKIKKKKDKLPTNKAVTGENSGAFYSDKEKNKALCSRDTPGKDNEALDIKDERLEAKALLESKSKKSKLQKLKKLKGKKHLKIKFKKGKKKKATAHCEIVADKNPDDFHADNDHNKSENGATTWKCDTEEYSQSTNQHEASAAELDIHGRRFSDFVKTRKRKNNKYLKCCCMRQEEMEDSYSPANEERKAGIFSELDEMPKMGENCQLDTYQLPYNASKTEWRKFHLINTASC